MVNHLGAWVRAKHDMIERSVRNATDLDAELRRTRPDRVMVDFHFFPVPGLIFLAPGFRIPLASSVIDDSMYDRPERPKMHHGSDCPCKSDLGRQNKDE